MEAQPVANHRYRNHDAFHAMLKYLIDSGQLGTTQNGLPVQLIISISKADLDAAAGMARTATGLDVPVEDVVKMAAECDQHLVVFTDHCSVVLYYGRARRSASQAQWMAMLAGQRGCTHPGCDKPAMWSQAHHAVKDWAMGLGSGARSSSMMGLTKARSRRCRRPILIRSKHRGSIASTTPMKPWLVPAGRCSPTAHAKRQRQLQRDHDEDGDPDSDPPEPEEQ